jgi:hypothetical protein
MMACFDCRLGPSRLACCRRGGSVAQSVSYRTAARQRGPGQLRIAWERSAEHREDITILAGQSHKAQRFNRHFVIAKCATERVAFELAA